jgi:hypothetical protein
MVPWAGKRQQNLGMIENDGEEWIGVAANLYWEDLLAGVATLEDLLTRSAGSHVSVMR